VGLFRFFADWRILPFDNLAADMFRSLRAQSVRIGSMDLKIASIVLVHDATLLSNNLRDFKKVPGLRVEDWL
jgi:tRNA(fMet)-specific endonuclease VapC